MQKKLKISILIIVALILVGVGTGVKNHMDNVKKEQLQKQAVKEKELKRIEDEIVVDVAKRYAGIKSVQFDEYAVSPMGTFDITLVINHNKNQWLRYQMDSDEDHPRLVQIEKKKFFKTGKSIRENIKIKYSFKEFK